MNTAESVNQGNIILDSFLNGRKYINDTAGEYMAYIRGTDKRNYTTQGVCPVTDLRYNKSWDWLMPVIEKIASTEITPAPNYTGYKIEIVPNGYVQISGFPMQKICKNVSKEGSLIKAVWAAAVDFVKSEI